jgi:hypothetical protein
MITTVISLIILIIAFFVISSIVFQPPYELKSQAFVFVPVKHEDIGNIETDFRTIMNDVNKNFKKTVKKVYLVNFDNDIEVARLCRSLCSQYPLTSVCCAEDLSKILTDD